MDHQSQVQAPSGPSLIGGFWPADTDQISKEEKLADLRITDPQWADL